MTEVMPFQKTDIVLSYESAPNAARLKSVVFYPYPFRARSRAARARL